MKRYSNWVLAAAAVLLAVTGLATRPLKAQTALSADGVIESTCGGKTVTVKAKVENPSPVATGAFDVALFLLDDTTTDGAEPVVTRSLGSLGAHRNRAVTLKHTSDQDVTGKLAVVVVDSGAAVREREEDNNVTWERLD